MDSFENMVAFNKEKVGKINIDGVIYYAVPVLEVTVQKATISQAPVLEQKFVLPLICSNCAKEQEASIEKGSFFLDFTETKDNKSKIIKEGGLIKKEKIVVCQFCNCAKLKRKI